ncbi:G-protein coupled receptor 84-like [Centropristis striata]|uniref:G-protein coupled receptor 84-like n=1 Tax=Centropristis striata TaxID=184440 RepID=UPI0027E00A98|nr:G-protein coupled receptor 84-like [Centropristis striata]
MLTNQTNQTEDDPFSCYSPLLVGYRYFAVVWGCGVIITGTVGNLMTILAFVLDPRLRTRFNVLIVNLAVADLLYCTTLQPFMVDTYLNLRWRSGPLWCSISALLIFVSYSVSIVTLCLVAMSRYLMVAKRAWFDHVFSNWGLTLLLSSAWALGLVSFSPLWPVFEFVPKVCACSFNRTRGRPYSTILLFFYFFVGLGCFGVFYLLIYRRVRIASKSLQRYRISRKSSRKKPVSSAQETDDSGGEKTCSFEMSSQVDLAQNTDNNTCETSKSAKASTMGPKSSAANESPLDIVPTSPSATPAPTKATPSGHSTASGDDKEMKHVTRMCLAVFLCFLLCFVPYIFLNTIDKHERAPQVVYILSANLTWLNSCINPMLYAVMNRQFRQAYHLLLTRAAAPFTCLWTWCSTKQPPPELKIEANA